MKAKIRNTEIFFDVAGTQILPKDGVLTENPVIFLIHGGPGGNHINYKYHSLELQKDALLVFIDSRGCGWSKKSKRSDYSLKNDIEDIEALRTYLGLNKIIVLGLSYGGMVAQGYAIKYGKNLDKLILGVTAPSFRFIKEARDNLSKIGTPKQIEVCNKYIWNGTFKNNREVNHYFKTMEPLYFVNKHKKRKKSPSGPLKDTISYQALNAGFSSYLHKFDFIPKLHKIKCPTLILAAEKDWICSPSQSKIIAEHIPNSTLKIFKNYGHALTSDVHDKYIKTIRQFLKTKK